MKLYGYFRSSAAYRVRIALNLKGIAYEQESVHLVKNGGEQHQEDYVKLNPQHLVPTLIDEDGHTLTQSMAIVEYLDEIHPNPLLLPKAPVTRAWVRSIAHIVGCDIHPLNNLRVLQYLKKDLGHSDEEKEQWYHHWIIQGFEAIEKKLNNDGFTEKFCFRDQPTMADLCLIPQVYNAERFGCPMDDFPIIQKINQNCLALDAFDKARPENQPDAA